MFSIAYWVLLRQHSFRCRTVATLRIGVLRKWRSGWNKFGATLWIAHHRKACVWVLRGQTEILRLMNGTVADFQRRWSRILLVIIYAIVDTFQRFFLLFAIGYRHPFIDLHRCIANGHPFFLPVNIEMALEIGCSLHAHMINQKLHPFWHCVLWAFNSKQMNEINWEYRKTTIVPMPNTVHRLHNSLNVILCPTPGLCTHRPWHIYALLR